MDKLELIAIAAAAFYLLNKTNLATSTGQAIGGGAGQVVGGATTGFITGGIQAYYQTIWNAQNWLYEQVYGAKNPWGVYS